MAETQIETIIGDIVQADTEAIVNAANNELAEEAGLYRFNRRS